MGKIYEGEVKLNVVQVCDKLRNELMDADNVRHAEVIAKALHTNGYNGTGDNKAMFAHAVLDAYKLMPNENDRDMGVRKLAKHLMEKYMKSTTTMTNEGSAFDLLCRDTMKAGGYQE